MSLPSVLCIGAPRSGTTSLYSYLNLHPHICVSRPKEPNYFTSNYGRGIQWYKQCFADKSKIGIDFSTSYSHYLNCPVVDRIHETMPRAKLIFLLRDPLDRLISNYRYNCLTSKYAENFETAVYRDYLLVSSLYYFTVQRFLRRFPMDQLLVIRTELLFRSPDETLKSVYGFINAEPFSCARSICANSIFEVAQDTGITAPQVRISKPLLERLRADLSYDWQKLRELTGVDTTEWENNPYWRGIQITSRLLLSAP
jgi:hypothetical protein